MPDPQPCPTQAYIYNARVIKVIDGDTIDCVVDLGFRMSTTQRFRLVDVNAPEMEGLSYIAGEHSKSYVFGRLFGSGPGRNVIIRTTKADDFGRWLCRIWIDGMDFNAELVAEGYAVDYRTGKGGA